MRLCKLERCTGCMACANLCPQKCISFAPDNEGFLRPQIDENACINCGLCAKKCPQNTTPDFFKNGKVYACWHRDQSIRKKSTSGGAFTAIAEYVFARGGVVYGAGFDENMMVRHKRIERVEDLDQLRGSKYVQSYIGEVYAFVQKDLKANRLVLFTGTPCQVMGLKACLRNKDSDNLITVDLVCHGVPSPKIYKDYLNHMEQQYGSKAKMVNFRNKKPGWFIFGMKIEFENHKVYRKNKFKDSYTSGFLNDYFIRPNCHLCQYTTTRRVADITIGDFWCFKSKNAKFRDTDKGISLCLLNSPKAVKAFESFSKSLVYIEDDLEYAADHNVPLRKPFRPNPNRAEFWDEYQKRGFEAVLSRFMMGEKIPRWALKQYVFKRIPTPIWKVLKKLC